MTWLFVSWVVIAALLAGGILAWAGALTPGDDEELLSAGQGAASQATQAAYWRELGQARDWESLRTQVRRWQQVATPGWSESEIEQVARTLNEAVFRFAMPAR